MATTQEIINATLESNVLSFVDNWMMPIEGEDVLPLEDKSIIQKPENVDEEDAMIAVIVNEMVDAVCGMLDGGDDTEPVLPPSETSDVNNEQGAELTAVEVQKEDVPAEGKPEEREDMELDSQKDPVTTPVTKYRSRSRPRRIFAAVWKGVKSVLLCGCCRGQ